MQREGRARVLFVDIENSPYEVYSWDNNPKTPISHDNIIREAHMISVAWKWAGSDRVYSKMIPRGSRNDRELTKTIKRVMAHADVVIAHFGDGHDIPWIQTRCLVHGLGPLNEVLQVDTWKIARNRFKCFNNKLDYFAKKLGLGAKLDTTFGLWKDVLAGDRKARRTMLRYNKEDVRLLERVWKRIRPFAEVPRRMATTPRLKKLVY